ncbi:MAG TPA: response regulator transcription factor [Chitinophagaceae bacterium]|nr:response regulator transcription factor [Chitinophagaceae bacterium]HRG93792.1 response regulator transcription factor [Chitinophagaceae bacterium]
MKVRLVIADDHELFIDGLQSLLRDEPDIEVVNTAKNGKELLHMLSLQKADLVLLDINMPAMNGLDAIRYLRQSFPLVKTIILSTYNDEHLIERAKSEGANGYLLKTTSKDELLQTIRVVAGGQACFPYRNAGQDEQFIANDDFLKSLNLTKREKEILLLLKGELTNQQIADKLFLSVYTIETHRKNIMQKLGLKSPAALHKFIYSNNIGG